MAGPPCLEPRQQGWLVHQLAPTHIDEQGAGFHRRKEGPVSHAFCLGREGQGEQDRIGLAQGSVQRVGAKILVPYILLFALYVQFHGDFGPGGGFQAGVIFAAGIVLFALIFGLEAAYRVVSPNIVLNLVALGVLLYGAVGVVSLVRGSNYLDYDVLSHDPMLGQHLGILLVELGVGITVTAVMVALFYGFAGRESR